MNVSEKLNKQKQRLYMEKVWCGAKKEYKQDKKKVQGPMSGSGNIFVGEGDVTKNSLACLNIDNNYINYYFCFGR